MYKKKKFTSRQLFYKLCYMYFMFHNHPGNTRRNRHVSIASGGCKVRVGVV